MHGQLRPLQGILVYLPWAGACWQQFNQGAQWTASTLLLTGCSGANLDGFLHASEGLAVPFPPTSLIQAEGRLRCTKASKGQAGSSRRAPHVSAPLTPDLVSIIAAQAAPRGMCRLSKTWKRSCNACRNARNGTARVPTATCAKVTKAQGQSGCKVLVAGQASPIEVTAGTVVKPRRQGFPKVFVCPDGIRLSRLMASAGLVAEPRR